MQRPRFESTPMLFGACLPQVFLPAFLSSLQYKRINKTFTNADIENPVNFTKRRDKTL